VMEKISFDAVVAEQVKRKAAVAMEYMLYLKKKIDSLADEKARMQDELTFLCEAPIVVAYEKVPHDFRRNVDKLKGGLGMDDRY
jgi:hypothetical protein